jgi:hypothetical protein
MLSATLPPIGSLVRIQAAGVESAYFALVVGHQQFRESSGPVVQVACHEYEGMPYSVYTSCMEVVGDPS